VLLSARAPNDRATALVPLTRRLLAEFVGSGLLTTVVVGSGIAAHSLSPGDRGVQLLENAAATGLGLFVLILMLETVSGAHFNPVVTGVDTAFGGTRVRDACAYVPIQVMGCALGAMLANVMFALPVVSISTHARATGPHVVAEVVATAGLVMVIFALTRTGRPERVAAAVGAYIGAAYFFTSSTSFANPAIAVGRMLSNSFAGIAPSSVPTFVLAEVAGGVVGGVVIWALYGARPSTASLVITSSTDYE
jgi:glycerol uptake facilitator-like aquaporin